MATQIIQNTELQVTLDAHAIVDKAFDGVHSTQRDADGNRLPDVPQSVRSYVYNVRAHLSKRIGELAFAEVK